MRAILWGREHITLGPVAVEGVGARFAVALSRGLHPKNYGYLDANEDVAVAIEGSRAALLAVADAHNGVEAGEVAIGAVLDALGDDPPPADLSDLELVELFSTASAAVRKVTAGLPFPRSESRTTLTVALVCGRRLQWAGMGDSAVVVAGADSHVAELTVPRAHFVGWPLTMLETAGRLTRGMIELEPAEWVTLVTDGYTNFAPLGDLGTILAGAPDARSAARQVVEHACAKGAGDNVAVAVAAPTSSGEEAG